MKGSELFQQGKYDEALNVFQQAKKASRERREELEAEYNIGLTHLFAKNYGKAKEILVLLAATTEMQNDPAVIYNAAAVLNVFGEVGEARTLFGRFPLSAPLPTDGSSRDIYAKAHWLAAVLEAKHSKPDCQKVKAEIAAANSIAPHLSLTKPYSAMRRATSDSQHGQNTAKR